MRKKKFFRIVAFACALAICLSVFAWAGEIGGSVRVDREYYGENAEDGIDHIKVQDNGIGGKDFEFKPTETFEPALGTIEVEDEYMYVFGYKYNSTAVENLNTTSLNGWVESGEKVWGCAVVDKTKTEYASPYGHIGVYDVGYVTYAFANCTQLQTLPTMDKSHLHTDHMCYNCRNLTQVELLNITTVGNKMFEGCTKLEKVYLGEQITTINGTPWYGLKNVLVASAKEDDGVEAWKKVDEAEVVPVWYEADYILWCLPYVPTGTVVVSKNCIYVAGYEYVGTSVADMTPELVGNASLWQLGNPEKWGSTTIKYDALPSSVAKLGGMEVTFDTIARNAN